MEAQEQINQLLSEPGAGQNGSQLYAHWIGTPLGAMLAVADDSGLLILEFADNGGLEPRLRRLQRQGTVSFARNSVLDSIEAELADYFTGRLSRFLTPLRTDGTEFQKSVWAELQRIPSGETISYRELAARVGRPTAFRAVAQANGANRLPIIIPCHRVISADGSIGGYGGGLERKRYLLSLEAGHRALVR